MSEFAALFPKIYFLRSHLVDKESYHLIETSPLSQKPLVLSRDLQSGESISKVLIIVLWELVGCFIISR